MAISTRDFGKYNLDLVRSVVGEQIDRDRIERRLKRKWWNRIIPKVEECQIIPNGISYKRWRNQFQLIFRIYRLKTRFCYNYSANGLDINFEKTNIKSLGFSFVCQYN